MCFVRMDFSEQSCIEDKALDMRCDEKYIHTRVDVFCENGWPHIEGKA
jgi:hypothetical protein